MMARRMSVTAGHGVSFRRETRIWLVLCGFSLLIACGRSALPPAHDQKMQQSMDAGRSAYDLGYHAQAISAYRSAYQRALLSNDQAGLGSAGYNLAVIYLRDHEHQAALRAALMTEKDLRTRGFRSPIRLKLVQAAAFYQGRDYVQASDIACSLTSGTDALSLRAHFFCGMSAVARGRDDQAQRSLAVLDQARAQEVRLRADRASLRAQLRWAQHAYTESLKASQEAVALTRIAGDYNAMRQMLDIAASSADRIGRHDLSQALIRQSQQSLEAENASRRPSDAADVSAGLASSHSE